MKKVTLIIFSFIIFNFSFANKPQLYLFLGYGSAKAHIKQINNPQVVGAQIIYSWKQLEPQKNHYDFSAIEDDYQTLKKYHKKLFIQLQDRTFNIKNIPLPRYLLTKEYNTGVIQQTDFAGEGKPLGEGWVTKQWNPSIKLRFHKLIKQLAKSFDGKIAGINLPETAIDINEKYLTKDFCDAYFSSIIDNMLFLRKEFKKSKVVQYVNFLPCEWNNDHGYMQKIFNIALEHNIGVGNPDTVPYRRSQMKNSYPFFNKYKSKLPLIAIAVQEPDYTYTNPKTAKKFTPAELYNWDKDYISANIIFWNTQQPQFKQVLQLFS
ncbi:hypothetical protein [Francisella sp. SYW-9]|uniref:hypothetical protein n=1 Tax=Francisella sp. SYW-9 TaxID=2610888 RepID=UPI00123C94B5|nr:hypothetical protein [Francisella sp. SYW-9]